MENMLFQNETILGKPFLKWAGGKTQLLDIIYKNLPSSNIETFIEPFIGSGAVTFRMLSLHPNIRVVINDINSDLINVYRVIKSNVTELIAELKLLEKKYISLDQEGKKEFFYEIRNEYNKRDSLYKGVSVQNAAYFIFLNRTCFNGLYRVNSKNRFNVPFGKYSNPCICNEDLLSIDSELLQRVTILNGDYSSTLDYASSDGNTLFYFDPPYKPISATSSFNSYSADIFDDNQQIRLKEFCDGLSSNNIKFLLSNSDPKSIDIQNNFFDTLYNAYRIQRVNAKRNINSKGSGRGEIKELLICNY